MIFEKHVFKNKMKNVKGFNKIFNMKTLKERYIENASLINELEVDIGVIFIQMLIKLFDIHYSSIPLEYYGDLFMVFINQMRFDDPTTYNQEVITYMIDILLTTNSDDYFINGFTNSLEDIVFKDSIQERTELKGGRSVRGIVEFNRIFNNFTTVNPDSKTLPSTKLY